MTLAVLRHTLPVALHDRIIGDYVIDTTTYWVTSCGVLRWFSRFGRWSGGLLTWRAKPNMRSIWTAAR